MAERIAGDQIEIIFPEMEGDPAFWEPAPEEIAAFQSADVILLNGASYAKWIPRVSLPQSRMVDTSASFKDQYIPLDGTLHAHGPGGAHAHGDIAFTTWLDPILAIRQAEAIQAALAQSGLTDPSGLQSLKDELGTLDLNFEAALTGFGNQPILGSHPVYQYLARRYQLNMESVHWEPDSEPDEQMWRELEDILETHKAAIMLWEDEPLPKTKAMLIEKGIQSIVFNPCGNRPEVGNFDTVMQDNIKNIADYRVMASPLE
jgi:zinc transport system substrate-binding protein